MHNSTNFDSQKGFSLEAAPDARACGMARQQHGIALAQFLVPIWKAAEPLGLEGVDWRPLAGG